MSRLLLLVLLVVGGSVPATAQRWVLAWPPTRYDSAELILHRGPGSGPGEAAVSVHGRGFDVAGTVPADGALRIELPLSVRCGLGVEPCALVVESAAPDLRVVLQSPSTRGVPDTLARTAHDTVRAAGPGEGGLEHVVLAAPSSSDHLESLSFVTVVPVEGVAEVEVLGGCAPAGPLTLAEGEAWTLGCTGDGADVSGSRVLSDAPVALLAGNVVSPVPVQAGSGWSADLVLDAPLPLGPIAAASTWLVPPLPRAATHAGLGDLVRCAAGGAAQLRIRDERGRDETRALIAGEVLDLDTSDPGGEPVLRLDAQGPVDCWMLTKSRAHRGSGDPAAVPLVPRELFTRGDRAFVPDGYGERTDLVVVVEAGGTVSLDGVPLTGLAAGPAGELDWVLVELPTPPPGEGSVLRLEGSARFGAWLFGQGGYKAHGLVAARGWPVPPVRLLRGARADELEVLAEPAEPIHRDEEPATPLWFYRLDGADGLRVSRCDRAACLDWEPPAGG